MELDFVIHLVKACDYLCNINLLCTHLACIMIKVYMLLACIMVKMYMVCLLLKLCS